MSQVAIVIDVPDYGPEALPGNTLLRIAGTLVKEIKKQLPIDDGVRLAEIAVAPALHIEQEWPVTEPEAEVAVVAVKIEPVAPKAKAKRKPAAKKPAAKKA